MPLWSNTDTPWSIPKIPEVNRGQLVAINFSDRGEYTEIPTLTISAPTSGQQATAIAYCRVKSAVVNAGGTGWSIGDTFTIDLNNNAANTIEAEFKVTAVDEVGAVTELVMITSGRYYSLTAPVVDIPAIPSRTRSELASDLTIDVTLEVSGIVFRVPGSGYTKNDTITVSFTPASTTTASAVFKGNVMKNGQSIVFVDRDESKVRQNILAGLNSPGWWLYKSYVDAQGFDRHHAELLVALDRRAADAGDENNDDAIVPDRSITITGVPATLEVLDGEVAVITATIVSEPAGAVDYQWQALNGITWADLVDDEVYSGSTTNELSITAAPALNDGQYRLVVSGVGFVDTYSTTTVLSVV